MLGLNPGSSSITASSVFTACKRRYLPALEVLGELDHQDKVLWRHRFLSSSPPTLNSENHHSLTCLPPHARGSVSYEAEVVCQADSPQDTKAYVCCRHTLFQIKLPKNRYPGAVNHGTHAPEKQDFFVLAFHLPSGKAYTEKAGVFFCCWFVLKSKELKQVKTIFISPSGHVLFWLSPIGPLTTRLFSGEPPFPHAPTRVQCPRRAGH